jgi:predicted permease
VRTLEKLRAVDLGFRAENVLLFSIDPTLAGEKGEAVHVLYQRIRDDVLQLPGVTSVTWSNVRPLSANLMVATLRLLGPRSNETLHVDFMGTGPAFFDTLGVGLLAGRTLTARDVTDAAAAQAAAERKDPKIPTSLVMPAVVNEAFVRKYFPGGSPIGERFQYASDEPSPTWEIVGVVRDMKYNEPRREVMPTVYLTTAGDGVTFEVRTAVDPMALVPGIRAAVARPAPRLALVDVNTQIADVDRVLFTERLMARLSCLFGALAVGLACIGLYALLSYEVSQRAREVGIRMALGARHGDVRRLVLKQGLVLTLAGILVGTVVALGVMRFLAKMLYGVPPTDPVVLVGVPVLLVAVAALACYLPARRAARVDPMVVLRAG